MNQLVAPINPAITAAQIDRKLKKRENLVSFLAKLAQMKEKGRDFKLFDAFSNRIEISDEKALEMVEEARQKAQAELNALDIQLNAIGQLMGAGAEK
jgi:hypothetical protein